VLSLYNQTWSQESVIETNSYTPTINPKPSLAIYSDGGNVTIYVAYHYDSMDENGNPTGITEFKIFKSTNGGSSWSTILGPIQGSNPSISVNHTMNNFGLAVAWENNSEIYMKYQISNWSSTLQVSSTEPYVTAEKNPSITYSNGKIHVAWQGVEELDEELEMGESIENSYYRNYDPYRSGSNKFSNITSLMHGGDPATNPSISSSGGTASNNYFNYAIVYTLGEQIYKLTKEGNTLTETSIASGNFPNITEHGRDGTVWTKYTSAPYLLKTNASGQFSKVAASDAILTRTLTIKKRFGFNFAADSLSTNYIALNLSSASVNWSEAMLDSSQESQSLRFTGSDEIKLSWKLYYKKNMESFDPNTALIDVYVTEGETRTKIQTLRLSDFDGSQGDSLLTEFTYSALDGKSAQLELEPVGGSPLITDLLSEAAPNFGKQGVIANGVLPIQFALHQNYPNPFNPVTHIRFDLPEAGQVSLKIYNVTGQLVAELVDGFRKAGQHEVAFDATGLASGIYIYRIQAGEKIEQKKMLLVR
jgi:hypothetical protein